MNNFVLLKQITSKIGSGSTPRGGSEAYFEEGISFIRSQNVQDMHFSKNGLVFLDEEQAELLKNVTVNFGDILLNITGDSVARSCTAPENILPARVSQHVAIVRCKDKKDAEYVGYYIQFLKPYLLQICKVGGTRNALTKEAISNLKINFPEDRCARAKILSAINKKIELNYRINAELEAMAKTLYGYWFVQFDFPNAKGKPYKTSGGKMVYNSTLKREIPEGWEARNILSVAHLLGGGTPAKVKPEYWNGAIPFFTPTGSDKNIYCLDTEDHITEEGLKNSSTKLFDKHTVFITARGSVGRLALNAVPMAMNQSCYALKAKEDISYVFVFFLTKELIHHLEIKATGSVFGSIVSNDIEYTNLALPTEYGLIRQYAAIAEPVFKKIEILTKENMQLSSLRDWLLPMLMNGQVTVK